ncbi:MAG: AbrB/MazE/SpoVT family DNA-binding domain-containing protein [bacterium]|nr:AbrB/MazE/SpoVT family DNA-binding domain-containing protein [bacterium]
MTQIVKPLRNGQITIPASFRDQIGFDPQTLLQLTLVGDEIRIKPIRTTDKVVDPAWMKKLYEHFSAVREEAKKYDEKTINDSIDQAVKAVRSHHD